MRHREFGLPDLDLEREVVHALSWNAASDLLALGINAAASGRIQVWHRSNYHWYLKFEERLETPLVHLGFDAERPYLLHTLVQGET